MTQSSRATAVVASGSLENTATEESVAGHVQRIQEQGYTVLPNAYSREEVELLRADLTELWEQNGRLPLYQDAHGYVAEDVEIWGLGLVFHKLLKFRPHLARHLLKPATAHVLRELLGDGAYIEKTGAVLSDTTRPFFQWHTHVGGIDDELYRRQGWTPQFGRAQRVVVLIYLNDLDADGGQVVVWPRRESDPNAPPPFPIENTAWDGQVEISCSAGSVVIIEQCTWHAVLPRKKRGVRMFIGAYYASADAPPTFDVDETLTDLSSAGELLRSFQPDEGRSVAAQGLDPSLVPSAFGLQPHDAPREQWARLIEGAAERAGGQLDRMTLHPSQCTFRFSFAGGTGVDLVLEPRDERRGALRRSRSFNILYRNVTGEPTDALRGFIRDAVDAVIARDAGSLRLSSRT